MATKTTVVKDEALVEPIIATEGEEPVFVVNVPGVQSSITSDATLVMGFYKQNSGTDLSATYLTGSLSVSGFTIVTKKFQNLKAGAWVWDIRGTVDGILREIIRVPFIVKRRNEV